MLTFSIYTKQLYINLKYVLITFMYAVAMLYFTYINCNKTNTNAMDG